MKDENNGLIITEFIGLRSKMYALKVLKSEEEKQNLIQKMKTSMQMHQLEINNFISNFGITKKAKGITRANIKNITFNDYFNALFNFQKTLVKQSQIIFKNHEVYTMQQEKFALNPLDNKRIINY